MRSLKIGKGLSPGDNLCPKCGAMVTVVRIGTSELCTRCRIAWDCSEDCISRWTCPLHGTDLLAFHDPEAKGGIRLWCESCLSEYELPDVEEPEPQTYLVQGEV